MTMYWYWCDEWGQGGFYTDAQLDANPRWGTQGSDENIHACERFRDPYGSLPCDNRFYGSFETLPENAAKMFNQIVDGRIGGVE